MADLMSPIGYRDYLILGDIDTRAEPLEARGECFGSVPRFREKSRKSKDPSDNPHNDLRPLMEKDHLRLEAISMF